MPTQISYNVAGDSSGQTVATPTVSFEYDEAGNRTKMTDGSGSVNYFYDTLSQLTSEARSFNGLTDSFILSYEYNLGGELTSLTGPNQFGNVKVGYDYDKIGRVTAVTGDVYAGGTDYLNSISYRAFGLKGMTYQNGKVLALQYDNRMRPTEWHVDGVMRWDYSYTNFGENTGRVTYAKNVDDGTLDRSYDYDNLGRLVVSHSGQEARWHIGTAAWAINGPYSQQYGYDQFGNRTHREGWGGSFGANNINENFTYANNKQSGLNYDAAGNYTAGGALTYDATGQQIQSGGGLTNTYDGDRLRTKKEIGTSKTYYLRSTVLGGQVVAELNENAVWNRGYVYLGGQMVAVQQNNVSGIAAASINWVHQDPVTKSQRITDGSGAIVSTIDLDPFGGETSRSVTSAFQPRKYTTYERDSNGSDDAMMRRYQSTQSRFSQSDPFDASYSLSDPQSFNRYSYVENDPVNFVDPSGLQMDYMCEAYGMCSGGGSGANGGWGSRSADFWGGGYTRGNGWGSTPRPGLDVIAAGEVRYDGFVFRHLPLDEDEELPLDFQHFGVWNGFFSVAGGGGRGGSHQASKSPCNHIGGGQGDINLSRSGKLGLGPTGGVVMTPNKIHPYVGGSLGASAPAVGASIFVRNGTDVSPGLNYSFSLGSVIGFQYSGKLDLRNIRSSLRSGSFSFGGTTPNASVAVVWVGQGWQIPCL